MDSPDGVLCSIRIVDFGGAGSIGISVCSVGRCALHERFADGLCSQAHGDGLDRPARFHAQDVGWNLAQPLHVAAEVV
jgi:hypothetical protein